MKILYGVQGVGNGHLAMARKLLPHLEKLGVEVDFLFSGRSPDQYIDCGMFKNVRFYRGLMLKHEAGKLSVVKTCLANNLWRMSQEVLTLSIDAYDLVLSDYEPISAWAAYAASKTCIGIAHQYAFLHHGIPRVPGYWVSKALLQTIAPADIYVGFHYKPFGCPVLPPLLEAKSLDNICVDQQSVLVYLHMSDWSEVVKDCLGVTGFVFHIFSASIETDCVKGHVHLHRFSFQAFHDYFIRSQWVITHAGFDLTALGLYHGKHLLVMPIKRQFEQLSNVLTLTDYEHVTELDSWDIKKIQKWLGQNESKLVQPVGYVDYAEALASWLINPNRNDLSSLSKKLWQQCKAAQVM